MFHRPLGCTAAAALLKQDSGTSQIEVNPTKVLEHQSHPVGGMRKMFDSYIIVHVSSLNRFHPSNARGLGRALRCHSMVGEKVLRLKEKNSKCVETQI